MKRKNLSSWAEDFDMNELSNEADEYNLSIDLLEEACDVLNRTSSRITKRGRTAKRNKECWQ